MITQYVYTDVKNAHIAAFENISSVRKKLIIEIFLLSTLTDGHFCFIFSVSANIWAVKNLLIIKYFELWYNLVVD